MVTGQPGEIVLDSKRYKLQNPRQWQKQPVLRAARKIAGGDTKYSDYDLWNVKPWNTWHLGRGEEYFETDGRYYDAWNLEARIRRQLTLGPHRYPTSVGGLSLFHDLGKPGAELTVGKAGGSAPTAKYAWAESFVAPTGNFTADMAHFTLKRVGTPPNVTVSLCDDDDGKPGTVLKSKAVAYTGISADEYELITFDWTGTQTLTAASTYWLVVSTTGLSTSIYYWLLADGGANYSGSCASSDANAWSWTSETANYDLLFELVGAEGQLDGLPVSFAFFRDTGAELVTDGAMDNWTDDDLDEWTESNCDAAEETSSPYGGSGSSAKVTASAANGYIYQAIGVTAGQNYSLEFAYKNTAADTASYGIYDATNSADILAQLDVTSSTDWADLVKYDFDAPTGCSSVQIRLYAKANTDIVWFDAVSLKNTPENLFCLAGSKVYAWDATNNKWDDDSAGLNGTGTDMQIFHDILVVAQGTHGDLRKKQDGTWGALTDSEMGRKLGLGIIPTGGDAGKVGLIKSGRRSGGDAHKVRCIAGTGDTWQSLKCKDGIDTVVGDSSADVTWIGQYMGSIWICKEDGVYEVGRDGVPYIKFPFFTQKATWNFEGTAVWHRNELMLPAVYGLWSFDGKSLKNIGPGVGYTLSFFAPGDPYDIVEPGGPGGHVVGLVSERQGRVKDLLPTVNALYAAIDAGASDSRFSSVVLWTGRGWHEVLRGDSINKRILAMGYTPAGTIESESRLWYGYGNNVFYAVLPDTTDDPYQWSGSKYENQGWIEFGWFNAGLFEVDKDWREVTVEAENVDDGSTLEIFYKLDDDTSYTSLGVIDDGTVGTAIASNQATLSFGTDTYGKRIRLKVYMATDDPDNTPKVTNVKLKYQRVPDPVYGWNFTLKLTDLDRTWRTQQTDFKTSYEKKEPVTLVDPYGASHTVRLDNMAETIIATETGHPTGCLVTVRAYEA